MAETRNTKRYIIIASLLCAISIVVMIIALNAPKEPRKGAFIPPEFESSAVCGTPNVPSELGYIEPYADGMTFRAGVCGEVIVKDGKADVYFTNKAENIVWLMLRITDEKGTVLASTGLVRPGEFVKTVSFDKMPSDGQKIFYKIMAYEAGTYYSMGYFKLATTAIIKEQS